MKKISYGVIISIFLFLVIFFFFKGMTTQPSETDSVFFHIPVAKSIISGHYFTQKSLPYKTSSYPTSFPSIPDSVLGLLILLHIPINLFNWISWLVLFFLLYKLALLFDLKKDFSLIFAITVSLSPTIIRLINIQTSDIWLDIFFVATLLLIKKPLKKNIYFCLLGITSGLLFGSKYYGWMYLFILFVAYGKQFMYLIKPSYIISFLIPFTLLGLSWYIRNIVVFGNPIYPSPFLGLNATHNLYESFWPHIKTIMLHPQGFIWTLNAFISEFQIWFLFLIVIPFIFINKNTFKKIKDIQLLITICFLSFFVYLMLPGSSNFLNVLSEIRYGHPFFICLLLISFLIAQYYKAENLLLTLSLVTTSTIIFLIFPILSYKPKIFILLEGIIVLGYLVWRNKNKYLT